VSWTETLLLYKKKQSDIKKFYCGLDVASFGLNIVTYAMDCFFVLNDLN